MKKYKQYIAGSLAVALVCIPLQVSAAATASALTLCEEYVRPVSILAPLSTDLTEVIKGSTLALSGTARNNGTLPLTDATVFVKIVSVKESRVVALLPAQLPLPLAPGGEVPFSVEWSVPYTLSSGSYAAESVLYIQGRHALKATFGTHLESPYEFTVVGEPPQSIQLDLGGASVNGGKPDTTEGVVRAPQDGALSIVIPISNDTDAPLKTQVEWSVYAWDGPRTDRHIATVYSAVKVHPRTTGETVLDIDDTSSPDYFLEGTMHVPGGPMVVYARVSRIGHRDIKLTTAGVGEGLSDGALVAYVCIESPDIPSDDVRLELHAKKKFLGVSYTAAEATFTGSVPAGTPFALAVPLSGFDSGEVVTTLYRGSTIVDTLTVPHRSGKRAVPYDLIAVALVMLVVVAGVVIARR